MADNQRQQRKAAGLCIYCGQPAAEGYVSCAVCRAEKREQSRTNVRRLRERRRAAGLCTSCGKNPAEPGHKTCKFCMDACKELYRANVNAGICTACGRRPARPGRKTCAECGAVHVEQAEAYYAKAAWSQTPIEDYARLLQEAMDRTNLDMRVVAERLQVKPWLVASWLAGNTPSGRKQQQLYMLLDLPPCTAKVQRLALPEVKDEQR